ncbi:hypothetical protein GEV41_11215 [Pseudomonas putida]|uniref:hypothetical protein n=1 Tax=Pseudomonas putida group TaxID=136845 RepID=UPI001570870C|nr:MULTISPECIES: hypothetical protein [Pseudomonas putida group]MCE0990025.1 hypothetical protein [Pseudomonas alloputida]QKL06962.1 hypothetical protein GEV41_11215 [Pseudomonas putida]WNI10651.1 hypothetical protein RIF00_12015 [Pseudomonas putida]
MNKYDFQYDQESFSESFKRHAESYDAALRKLWAAFDNWPAFAEKVLGGKAELSLGALGDRVSGHVLGKRFQIDFAAVSSEGLGLVEAVISVSSIKDASPVEVARFFSSPEGDIISVANEILMTSDDSSQSNALLIAVVNKVMQASPSL